jgi:predicted TIM-barrel fold metal-dependent hydrolase
MCAAALATALLASVAVERAAPGVTRPPRDAFSPLRIPRIDFHQRVEPAALDVALRVADVSGVAALVNLSGGAEGGALEQQLAAAREHDGRVHVFMNLDERECCDAAWAARETARLARGSALGARGLALSDARVPLTGDAVEPLWATCAELGLPVVLGEQGAPDEREALVARHPRVVFVGAHFDERADDPAAVARAMDRLPNLWVDLAARIPELGGAREATRQAILAHPDRVLFGTGIRYVDAGAWQGVVLATGLPILLDDELLGGKDRRIFFESTYRFLETRDAAIPDPTPRSAAADLTGIGLSREVLHRVYHRNAERLLRLRTREPSR